MTKKLIMFLLAVLVAFSVPAAALGEEIDEDSGDIETYEVDSNMGGTEEVGADGSWTYKIGQKEYSWAGVTEGTITGFQISLPDAATPGKKVGFVGPNIVNPPKSYEAIGKTKTVLNAMAFDFEISDANEGSANRGKPILTQPGATIEFTYNANQGLVANLAKENGIKTSDIYLFVYEEDLNGDIRKLAFDVPAADSAEVTVTELRTGTFVMALAVDTDLLNAAKAKLESESSSGSDSSSDINSDYVPYVHPTTTLLVATGKDDSASSPKTGQSIPTETAPLALLATVALGAAALFVSRRRRVR